VKVLPRFNCQREDVVHNILTNANVRGYWLDQMVATVEQNGYDGVQMDFEKGLAADRGAMTSFVTELAARLHARGRLLSVAVSPKVADVPNHPRSSAFDYIALAQHADWVFVMAWGIHWQTSAPGAVDDLTWFNRVMAYMDTLPDHGRYVVGTQLYGLDWANGGGTSNPAAPYEWSDAQALAARVGATPHRDATTDNWTFSYQDGNGSPHEVWYTDSVTTHTRMQLARDRGFGVGFWRLGNEDQRLWSDPLIQP
jgi:spore germination protein YaaH